MIETLALLFIAPGFSTRAIESFDDHFVSFACVGTLAVVFIMCLTSSSTESATSATSATSASSVWLSWLKSTMMLSAADVHKELQVG